MTCILTRDYEVSLIKVGNAFTWLHKKVLSYVLLFVYIYRDAPEKRPASTMTEACGSWGEFCLLIVFALYTLEVNSLLSACVLIRTAHGRFEDVVKFLGKQEGVKRIFPTLGRYDVVVDMEASDLKALDATVLRMGKFAGVVFTETLVEIKGRGEAKR
jgi:uncharacterized protein with GYD domain